MIEVIRYKEVNEGKKIAFVDIKLKNGMIIRHIAYLASDKGKWFNFPSFAEDQPDGSKKYSPIVEWSLAVHNAEFMEKINAAVKEYKEKNKIIDPEPLEIGGDLPF